MLKTKTRAGCFQNRVQSRIFGTKMEETVGDRRRFNNEDLHNFYSSSNFIRMIETETLKLAELVACMRNIRNTYKVFSVQI
jgi:hypothetical protein